MHSIWSHISNRMIHFFFFSPGEAEFFTQMYFDFDNPKKMLEHLICLFSKDFGDYKRLKIILEHYFFAWILLHWIYPIKFEKYMFGDS